MKIPLSWLREYVELPPNPEEIANTLTLAGLEVDAVTSLGGTFSGVVVGKVVQTKPHPDADRLKIADVFDGTETLQIVCGDPSCSPGLTVALAKVGAKLPGEDGKPWTLKKGKLRGVESFGMLCALDELGLSKEPSEGILKLPSSLQAGQDLASLYQDTLFDISLTPNLGHCQSLYGVARELSLLLQTPLKPLEASSCSTPKKEVPFIHVNIEASSHCKRYMSRLVRNVEIGPSPEWLVRKLELLNIKSINCVVDISNYVLMLTGQPLHFFDYEKITGPHLYVSSLETPASLRTLDGVERTLSPSTLVIKDKEKLLAIAGIMGGDLGSVTEATKHVLIEAAHFDPVSIRKAMRSLGVRTEASSHFEKGIDLEAIPLAINLAADLLESLAKGTVDPHLLDIYSHPEPAKMIVCRKRRVESILGLPLSQSEIRAFLTRAGCLILQEEEETLTVSPPSFRGDLKEEIDLIEEIARLYGFHHLPKRASYHVSSPIADAPLFTLEQKVRSLLLGEGLQEFLTCDLVSPALSSLTKEKSDHTTREISVLQSKSLDYSVLRTTLLTGLLQVVKYNCDHETRDVCGFEVGKIHFTQKDIFHEQTSIGLVLSGLLTPHHHEPKPREVDFFDVKGMVENLLMSLRLPEPLFEISHLHNFQPGRQARIKINDIYVGVLGEVHPTTLASLDLPQRVYFAELHLEELFSQLPPSFLAAAPPTMPSSERDWTLTLRKEVPMQEVLSTLKELAPSLLEKVYLLDLFTSEKLGSDRKNATFRFVYRDPVKTIQSELVELEHTKYLQTVAKKLASCIVGAQETIK